MKKSDFKKIVDDEIKRNLKIRDKCENHCTKTKYNAIVSELNILRDLI